jgi:hypothetical protein
VAQPRQIVQVTVSAGTAFKIGCYGAIGAAVAGLLIGAIFWIVVLVLFGSLLASFHPTLPFGSPSP